MREYNAEHSIMSKEDIGEKRSRRHLAAEQINSQPIFSWS